MSTLTALQVKHAKPGDHSDGKGLILRVRPSGSRSWVLRVQHQGKRRDIGLGSIDDLTLAEAREKAAQLRKIARQGLDARAERDRKPPDVVTFARAIELAHAEYAKGWTDKAGDAFLRSLADHVVPIIGTRPVDAIEAPDVLAALTPIWTTKPQQALKVRQRILKVLHFAKAHGLRSNPVPGADELRRGLSDQPESQGLRAVPYREVPALFADELAKQPSPARLALLFTILTAARSGEVRGAEWSQIDRQSCTWKRAAKAMKSRREHVVTLNPAALAILDRAAALYGEEGVIFPSLRGRKPLSDMALSKILHLAGRDETVHGFRSSFRDWAAEQMPEMPAEVAEKALAHSIGSKVVRAYLRSDLLEQRRTLLDAWGAFVAPKLGAA